jgi:hypothetical protein
MSPSLPIRHDARRGVALLLTLLLSLAVAAMALGAVLLSSGARLTTRFSAREVSLQAAANGGLELVRDSLNHGIFDSLLPANGFTTLETDAAVRDAAGGLIPGMTRSLYVGRTGGRTGGAATAGQYGSNFASALSVIRDRRGAVAARRLLMTQDSWSKFAVAINDWSGSAVYGCGESVTGPFHSNDVLRLQSGCSGSSRIGFAGLATVVGSISNVGSGSFAQGYRTGARAIPWPTPARIALMRQYAQDADAANGDYDLAGLTLGSHKPPLRIEFLTIDADGSGTIEWDEGYMRVWQGASTADSALAFTTARLWLNLPSGSGTTSPNDPNMVSRNCGATITLNGTARWYTAREVWDAVTAAGGNSNARRAAVRWLLSGGEQGSHHSATMANITPTARACYLGGDPMLYASTQGTGLTPAPAVTNTTSAPFGEWRARRTGAHGTVSGLRSDAAYLIPLGANPNFKGVIYVSGDVAISGRVRGRVSVFATGNIVLADDLLYHNAPGTACDAEGDIFGAIATRDVVIADNSVQTPFNVNGRLYGGFDDTPRDEQYNLFFLAAGTGAGTTGNFYTSGLNGVPGDVPPYRLNGLADDSAVQERCANAPAGCIRVTGGLAMGRVDYYTYAPVGNAQAYGYAEAHTYDRCGAVNPPPYFPTTGQFSENRYYEVDPVWLNQKGISDYFAALRAQ